MWLRVVSGLGLIFAVGCASSGDDDTGVPLPMGGNAGGVSGIGAGGMPPPSGAAASTSPPPMMVSNPITGAGSGATGGVTAPPPVVDAGMMTKPDAGGMDVPDSGGGGTGGTTAGTGGTMAPATGGHIREADPTEASAKKNGEYATMKYTNGLRAPMAYGGGTIYYPTSAEAVPPFGAVAIVPGFTAYQSSIAGWGPFLASHGIIVFTIDTITTADPPASRALGLMDALETVKAENTREGSPIKGKVDLERLGVAGWSMGGGGTLIAASNNPTLKAGVSFCAWGPTGGTKNTVPVLMFEGTVDVLAAGMSEGYYGQTMAPKMLFEVAGGDHFVANDPSSNAGIIGMYGLSWFKVFLEGDERYRKLLTAPLPSIVTMKSGTNVK